MTSETLGERLKKIREGRGLDYGKVETETSIRTDYLKCLEDGDYASLPGEIYAKNFLKVYGGFLGLDEEAIIEQYENERKADDYWRVAQYAARGRDLFGNKRPKGLAVFYKKITDFRKEKELRARIGLGWRELVRKRLSFRNIVLSQIFIKGMGVLLILGVLFYLGLEITKIIRPPALTIFEPADNLIVAETEVVIQGVVEKGAMLKINESEINYDDKGYFRERMDLKKGLNEIRISAKKEHSREKTVTRRVAVE